MQEILNHFILSIRVHLLKLFFKNINKDKYMFNAIKENIKIKLLKSEAVESLILTYLSEIPPKNLMKIIFLTLGTYFMEQPEDMNNFRR